MNTQSKGSSRRQREIARTRADIVEAALRAFGRRGFAATTMHDIAQEADYSAASLYSYFENKEAISEAIVALLTTELLAVFDEPMPPRVDFGEKVATLVARHLEHAFARSDAFAAMQEGAQRAPCAPGSVYDRHLQRATVWMRHESTRGDRGGASPEDAGCAFVGIVGAFFRRWLCRGRTGPLVEQSETITRLFLQGLGPSGHVASAARAHRSSRQRALPGRNETTR